MAMETITTRAEIDSNGMLRLELSTGLTPGLADVVIVVHSTTSSANAPTPSLSGRFAAFAPRDFDPVEEVRQIRTQTTREAREIPE
jgi:hypothetical protein